MKSFLHVTYILLPAILYFIAGSLGFGLFGAVIAVVWACVAAILRYRRRRPPAFEIALISALTLSTVGHLTGLITHAAQSEILMMGMLAGGALISLFTGQPWTAVYSAGAFGGASATPLFHRINLVTSTIWALIFFWLAFAAWMTLPPLPHYLPLGLGAIVSIFLPAILMNRGLAQMAQGDKRNNWPAPSFNGNRQNDSGDELNCDVAVIGAGIGGLTAAALLAEAGLRVTVFEQHNIAGGFAHNWVRRTQDPETGEPLWFRFDSGVHDISGWHPGGTVRSLFERLDIAHPDEWRRLDHRYIIDGRTIDVPRVWSEYVDQLATAYPHAATGIKALFAEIHAVYEGMFSTAVERGGIPGVPSSASRVLAFAQQYPLAATWRDQPWTAFVERHIHDPKVQQWLAALSGYITDDLRHVSVGQMVPIFGYYFKGGYYPLGGSGRMAQRLVEAIEARGGRVQLQTEVTHIVTDVNRATGIEIRINGKSEHIVSTEAIVCNADARSTFTSLLGNTGLSTMTAQAGLLRPSCSAIGVNLGLRGKLDLPPVIHVDDGSGFAALVAPSVVDPTCAPPGFSTLSILALLPTAEACTWFPTPGVSTDSHRELRRSSVYLERKREWGDQLIARARHAIPDLDSRIIYRTDASPVTFQRYAWTSCGAIYGVQGERGMLPTKTPIQNLVLAGAATHGPGIEAVVISGAYAADALVPGLLSKS